MTLALFLAAPIIALLFSFSEHLGWWDYLSGRKKAIEGFDRLRSAHGFPVGFIYNDDLDREVFNALEKRIVKNTRDADLRQKLNQGYRPTVITVIGHAQPVSGLPLKWEQSARFFYPGEQPIIMGFNWARTPSESPDGNQNGFGCRAGTLADLREWLEQEKEHRKFWINTVVVSCISIGSILLRVKLQ